MLECPREMARVADQQCRRVAVHQIRRVIGRVARRGDRPERSVAEQIDGGTERRHALDARVVERLQARLAGKMRADRHAREKPRLLLAEHVVHVRRQVRDARRCDRDGGA